MNPMGGRQRGVVAVIIAIGLLALLAMVGLALDSGHMVLNKSRLQNTVDAAALAAAKVLDTTASEDQATAAARSVFDLNAANHAELSRVMSGADISLQYSNTLNPFVPGTTPANYVRVVANDFTMWTGFTSLVGFNDSRVAATAVAGPSAPIGMTPNNEACDLVPMMVCADMSPGAPGDFGYTGENVTLLKMGSNVTGPIGPGNFQLFELGGAGANVVRQNLAGAYNSCIIPDGTITTKPGNNTGPTAQGLNTRFGQGGGMKSTDFPPDKVTTQPNPNLDTSGDPPQVILRGDGNPVVTDINQLNYTYDDYVEDLDSGPFNFPSGVAKRRVLAVPFVDCSSTVNGHGTIPVVGFGCFFLLQEVIQRGNENFVFAEYIGDCGAGGTPGPVPNPDPVATTGIYRIVLHNDPSSPDS
jgi:Flp pilus assembly protein TadG